MRRWFRNGLTALALSGVLVGGGSALAHAAGTHASTTSKQHATTSSSNSSKSSSSKSAGSSGSCPHDKASGER